MDVRTPHEVRDAEYVGIVIPKLSIVELCAEYPQLFHRGCEAYMNEQFANDHGEKTHVMMRKKILPRSTMLWYEAQIVLIGEGRRVPTAREVVCVLVAHYLATSERLLETGSTRTSNRYADGRTATIGPFTCHGMNILPAKGEDRFQSLGITEILL